MNNNSKRPMGRPPKYPWKTMELWERFTTDKTPRQIEKTRLLAQDRLDRKFFARRLNGVTHVWRYE